MNSLLAKWKSKDFLLLILFLQLIMNVTIFIDVPVARQVIGFLYFTFIPGFLIVKLLKINEIEWLEKLLFSVGFSIAFLMLAGLLINELGTLLGISKPLSIIPLLTVLNSFVLVCVLILCRRDESFKLWNIKLYGISPLALLISVIPTLSIVGAMFVNIYQNNLILLLMLIAITFLFIIIVLSKEELPKTYPFAIFIIAIAIVYHSSIISNYLLSLGSDVPSEYFVFKMTESNAHWDSTIPLPGPNLGKYNTMLSITVLPTIYSVLFKMDSTWIFKLIFPFIFTFVPLGLYQIWQTYISKKYAFVSAFLLTAQATFYTEMLRLNRQMIAELFFVLLLLTIMNKMKPINKMICFMLFSFTLVTSHYALAAIFLFFISFALVSLFILKRPSKNIKISMVVFFSITMFTWYIYTSKAITFNSFLEVGNHVYQQLGDFFNFAARGETVLRGLGLETPPTIWNAISRSFAYLTQALIAIGFVAFIAKRTNIHMKNEYSIFSTVAMGLLAMLIAVPGLAQTLNMTRFYHVLLFFLAPFCVLGAEFTISLLSKRKRELAVSGLLLFVLVPYFLFQTEFVYEIVGNDCWSVPLSGYRMNPIRLYGHFGYIDAYSVYSAQWLSKNVNIKNSLLYVDERVRDNVLIMYGMIPRGYPLSNTTIVTDNDIVYLSTLNVIKGVVTFQGRFSWNISEISSIFDDLNIIYSNGGGEIYKNMP
jgi:uncharacterized membrane protein